jgi:hypothetical protein
LSIVGPYFSPSRIRRWAGVAGSARLLRRAPIVFNLFFLRATASRFEGSASIELAVAKRQNNLFYLNQFFLKC